jgi:hypothetical protein
MYFMDMENQFLQMIREYMLGVSLMKLKIKYNISIHKIRRILHENNITIRPAFVSKTEKVGSKIIKLYESGMDSNEIGRKFNIAGINVRKYLRQHGVKRRIRQEYCKKYPINIDQFRDPSSEVASYWTGFLMADGYLKIDSRTQTHLVKIKLQGRDIGHLYNFARDLQTTKQPKLYDDESFGKPKKVAQILIMNKELYDLFISYGVKDFKRLGEVNLPPTMNLRHWLRGLIDGDGIVCLSSDKKKRLVIGFVCPQRKAVEWVRDHINKVIEFPRVNKINEVQPSKMVIYTTYWSGFYAIKLAKYLYCDSTRYLNRKLQRVLPFIIKNQTSQQTPNQLNQSQLNQNQ